MKTGPKPRPLADRFWPKVNKNGPIPEHAPHLGPCWIWTARVNPISGYGQLTIGNGTQSPYAHRLAYELAGGTIPPGYQVDHLCRVPTCVNPAHLEAVTPQENTLRSRAPTAINARKTHCVNGHELTPENTGVRPNGRRFCRECGRKRCRLRYAKYGRPRKAS